MDKEKKNEQNHIAFGLKAKRQTDTTLSTLNIMFFFAWRFQFQRSALFYDK